jgi:hypothetical protein
VHRTFPLVSARCPENRPHRPRRRSQATSPPLGCCLLARRAAQPKAWTAPSSRATARRAAASATTATAMRTPGAALNRAPGCCQQLPPPQPQPAALSPQPSPTPGPPATVCCCRGGTFSRGLARVKEYLAGGGDSSVCLICLGAIRPSEAVWSCGDSCYAVMHMVCVQVRRAGGGGAGRGPGAEQLRGGGAVLHRMSRQTDPLSRISGPSRSLAPVHPLVHPLDAPDPDPDTPDPSAGLGAQPGGQLGAAREQPAGGRAAPAAGHAGAPPPAGRVGVPQVQVRAAQPRPASAACSIHQSPRAPRLLPSAAESAELRLLHTRLPPAASPAGSCTSSLPCPAPTIASAASRPTPSSTPG